MSTPEGSSLRIAEIRPTLREYRPFCETCWHPKPWCICSGAPIGVKVVLPSQRAMERSERRKRRAER